MNTPSGEMFRLYNAAFARFPNADGLKYWIEKFTSCQNIRRVVAKSFLLSNEFQELYGQNISKEKHLKTF